MLASRHGPAFTTSRCNSRLIPFFKTLLALALLAAGASQVAALTASTDTVPNHFQCYAIKPFAFPSIPSVSLVDQFGASTVALRRPDQLCAPADINDEDTTAPMDPDHLTRYKVVEGAEPKLEQEKIVNEFGTIELDVIGAMSLMVPSAKSLAAPAPPALANPAVDHFQCYKVRVSTGAKFHKIVGVKVDDQFGTGTFDLLEPKRPCAPVDKNNENPGAEAHPDHLLCYRVKAPAPFNTLRVWLGDQFGSLNRLRLIQRQEFCVPSLKNPVPTTTTSTTTSTTSSTTTSTTSSTTTSTTSSTTTTSTSTTTSTTAGGCPVLPPDCNGPFTIPRGCPCSLNCSNCVGSVCNTVTGFCQ